MATNDFKSVTDRRRFLGSIATGAAAMGLATLTPSIPLNAGEPDNGFIDEADIWFNKVKGKHRIVFDVVAPNDLMPFVWPRVFLMTNGATGSPEKDCGVVVILRHDGICYGFDNNIWEKYKLGEMMKANDPKTKAPSTRNPFWKPAKDDFKVPGIGAVSIGINDLQASGVMFCLCNAAFTVFTAVAADMMKMNVDDVRKEWKESLLPGIQMVPSGVWAVGRAQEHGCQYCYAS